jgi:hypothetical protein
MGLTQRLEALRERGWAVAVHNDYRQQGLNYTFWLFTKGDRCAKGEGRTDEDALAQVEAAVASVEAEVSLTVGESAVRLGDQARVRRALDKFVRTFTPRGKTLMVGSGIVIEKRKPTVCLAGPDGSSYFELGSGSSADAIQKNAEACLVAFLEEVLRG